MNINILKAIITLIYTNLCVYSICSSEQASKTCFLTGE